MAFGNSNQRYRFGALHFLVILTWVKMFRYLYLAFAISLVCFTFSCVCGQEDEEDDTWPIIGIDLGTTYSCVGIFQDGRVEIIANDQGNRITPSYVSFSSEGERLLGEAAKNQASLNPHNTVFDVKRLIGRKFDDPEVQRDKKLYPFKIINHKGKPQIEVEVKGETKRFSPEEISAMVLKKMKETAETYLGKPVKNAVITCPAYFNDAQRQATKDAGTIAGLKVQRIVNEPTAAAIAYGHNEQANEKNILVFDLGGGTFDVSILSIEDGVFEVLATNGDTHLGGEDFDQRVMEHLLNTFKKKTGKDSSKDKRSIQKLRREVERAKRTLSYHHQARIEIESFHDQEDLSESLTRAKFEELNMDLFKKTLGPVRRVLKDANLAKDEIDEVILVGGSSRIPKIQQLLSEFFNGKQLNKHINPDEAVAQGAALQAAIIGRREEGGELGAVLDINSLSLGIETVGGVMTPIIPRGTPIPTKKTQTFSTHMNNQDRVLIQVYEGERSMTRDNHFLGKFELSKIPPAPRGVPQIEVTFTIDVNGILDVSAHDIGSGEKKSVTIKNDQSRFTQAEIERMVAEAEQFAEEDRIVKERIEAKNSLENYVYQIENSIQDEDKKSRMDPEDIEILNRTVKETLEWIRENENNLDSEAFKEKYHQIEQLVHPIFAKFYENEQTEEEPIDTEL